MRLINLYPMSNRPVGPVIGLRATRPITITPAPMPTLPRLRKPSLIWPQFVFLDEAPNVVSSGNGTPT